MAKTCAELITRIKQLVGRSTNVNSGIDIDNIILDGLNEAQIYIVRNCPHILELQIKDTTTLDTVLDQYSYNLSGFTIPIAHICNVWIMDGSSSIRLKYMEKEHFDRKYPDISDIASGCPYIYTRRANTIEFNCPVDSSYAAKDIRVDYTRWAAPFTLAGTTAVSTLINADRGLEFFAWADTLRILAKGNVSLLRVADEKKLWFDEWLDDYSDYYEKQIEELLA